MWTTKALIRLGRCTDWSGPLLSIYGQRHFFSWWDPILFSAGFGTSTSTGTSLFGQPAGQTGSGLFGQNKPFGAATTTQSTGFGFGATSTGTVFGQPQQSTVSILDFVSLIRGKLNSPTQHPWFSLRVVKWGSLLLIHGAIFSNWGKYVLKVQGPVVQSVVSLTSSLRVISLTVLADSVYNILIFFAEKMWVAFALQKLLTFFQQKISAYLRITQLKF